MGMSSAVCCTMYMQLDDSTSLHLTYTAWHMCRAHVACMLRFTALHCNYVQSCGHLENWGTHVHAVQMRPPCEVCISVVA